MSNFHRPRTYRSHNGCCICGAKSSSSRFTDSSRFESYFSSCFQTMEVRSGDICNACVLLVKRWKKLPANSSRNWRHVVDARCVSRFGSMTTGYNKKLCRNRIKPRKLNSNYFATEACYERDIHSDACNKCNENSSGYTSEVSAEDQDCWDAHELDNEKTQRRLSKAVIPNNSCSFIDMGYWQMKQVCCGAVFCGKNGEVLLDASLWKPCKQHHKYQPTKSSSPFNCDDSSNSSGSSLVDISDVCITDHSAYHISD